MNCVLRTEAASALHPCSRSRSFHSLGRVRLYYHAAAIDSEILLSGQSVRVWFVLMNRWFYAVRAFGTGSKGDPQRRAAPPFEFAPFENPPP